MENQVLLNPVCQHIKSLHPAFHRHFLIPCVVGIANNDPPDKQPLTPPFCGVNARPTQSMQVLSSSEYNNRVFALPWSLVIYKNQLTPAWNHYCKMKQPLNMLPFSLSESLPFKWDNQEKTLKGENIRYSM